MLKVRRDRNALSTAAAPVVESMEDRVLFNTYVVSNTNNSGGGSFRDAIYKANANGGADTIQFKIGSGIKTITSRRSPASPTSTRPHRAVTPASR
jgi:hypothetical protein